MVFAQAYVIMNFQLGSVTKVPLRVLLRQMATLGYYLFIHLIHNGVKVNNPLGANFEIIFYSGDNSHTKEVLMFKGILLSIF